MPSRSRPRRRAPARAPARRAPASPRRRPEGTLAVSVLDRSGGGAPGEREVARLLSRAARLVGAPPGEVAVLFTGDAEIRRLNRRFRSKDRPTDVLAFPDAGGPGAEEGRIGDVIVSVPAAGRNAREAGRPLAIELRHLVLHGFLHLLGYDHEVDGGEMEALEADLAARLGSPRRRRRAG